MKQTIRYSHQRCSILYNTSERLLIYELLQREHAAHKNIKENADKYGHNIYMETNNGLFCCPINTMHLRCFIQKPSHVSYIFIYKWCISIAKPIHFFLLCPILEIHRQNLCHRHAHNTSFIYFIFLSLVNIQHMSSRACDRSLMETTVSALLQTINPFSLIGKVFYVICSVNWLVHLSSLMK